VKTIKIVLYIIIGVVFALLFYYAGAKIAGIIGAILAALGIIKTNKQRHKEAQIRIDKAGEEYEAKKHDADSALDMYDDFFSDDDGE